MGVIEEELARHGSYASVAIGESMRPLLVPRRDVVIIEPIVSPPRKYDVILYRDPMDRYVLHRVISVHREHFVTRGDNTYVNERVPSSRVVGIMTAFSRNGDRTEVTDKAYLRYSKRRLRYYPVRRCYVKLRAFLGAIKRKIFKKRSR